MKRPSGMWICSALTALALAAGVASASAQTAASQRLSPPIRTDSVAEVARLRADSVVALHTMAPLEGTEPPYVQQGLGSGIVIDAHGLILTNAHVIEGVKVVHVRTPEGDDLTATVIGFDVDLDLALVRASDARGLRPAPLGDSNRLRIGDWVVAIGNPFGLHHTVTTGIVSAKGRALDDSGVEFLQTDAALGPGSSGGPLLDLEGHVVGINVGILPPGGMNVGLNLAIPVAVVKEVLPDLLGGPVAHGWIGVMTAPLSAPGAARRTLRDGLLVTAVVEDGPAARAGLLPGDIVTGFADAPSAKLHEFYPHIRRQSPGTVVRLEVSRKGERLVVGPIEIGQRPRPE